MITARYKFFVLGMFFDRKSFVRRFRRRSLVVVIVVFSVFLFLSFFNVFWEFDRDEERPLLTDNGVRRLQHLLLETANLNFSVPDWNRPTCIACDVSTEALAEQRPTVYSRTRLNCVAMLQGDESEAERARHYMRSNRRRPTHPRDYVNRTSNCAEFRRSRGYASRPMSREEAEFPIAFSILVFKDAEQVERLVRSIYAPQNVYCIHIDAKASTETTEALRAVAGCFDNVFVASRREDVRWGHFSIVRAEIDCLEELIEFRWKYFINLSGQMFPAHSNRELVRILRVYDGANDVEGTYKRSTHIWLQIRNLFSWWHSTRLNTMLMTLHRKTNAPHNATVFKGSNQVAVTRAFVVYFLYSTVSRDLIEWFADTMAPDEYIWPTLNHNPQLHAPGSYKGDPEAKVFTARASVWSYFSEQVDWSWEPWSCRGRWVRGICIFGVGDLPWLGTRPELFVNKFHADFEWLAYDCMEELIFNRTVYPDRYHLNLSYYERLSIARNKATLVTSVNETLAYVQGHLTSD